MKQFVFLLCFCASFGAFSQSQTERAYTLLQERGEICFSFTENNTEKIRELSKIVSLDGKKGTRWIAYANKAEFAAFLEKGYVYEILSEKAFSSKVLINMATTVAQMSSWDGYPTYNVYLQMMQNFTIQYPELCQIDTIGYSVENRLILCAKISKDVQENKPKPQFFYTAAMHGDELTGYVIMLRLIDYLLANPNAEPLVNELLESAEIYINPLSNPDGTYWSSNMNVSRAKRYNSNDVDLNRNFPDPFEPNPNHTVEKENLAMIDYAAKHKFVMSANLHGGAEVFNYPWDSYLSQRKPHADKDWWVFLGRRFVDTCWKFDADKFADVSSDGVTPGGDWYVISGGRQDYMNVVHNCRELTLEISEEKLLSTDLLNKYWDIEYRPLLNNLQQVTYGFRGIVTDSVSGNPIAAKITIQNHDDKYSVVYASLPFGNYYRPIKGGTYTITFSADKYESKTIENSSIEDFQSKELNVQLVYTGKSEIPKTENLAAGLQVYPNPAVSAINVISKTPITRLFLFNLSGKQVMEKQITPETSILLDLQNFPAGMYFLKVQDIEQQHSWTKFIKK